MHTCVPNLGAVRRSCRKKARLKEYSSLQENPYNVRYSRTALIVHNFFIDFAPWGVDNV